MDENKKVVVNLPEGTTQAEIIVREGEAPEVIKTKNPEKKTKLKKINYFYTSSSCRCLVHAAHKEHSCVHAHCHHYHM